jgi:hypothetical protein
VPGIAAGSQQLVDLFLVFRNGSGCRRSEHEHYFLRHRILQSGTGTLPSDRAAVSANTGAGTILATMAIVATAKTHCRQPPASARNLVDTCVQIGLQMPRSFAPADTAHRGGRRGNVVSGIVVDTVPNLNRRRRTGIVSSS